MTSEKIRAIVIGAGPSIKTNNHLKQIAQSNFSGWIVLCDRMLAPALRAGITPDKFKMAVVTLEIDWVVPTFFEPEIIKQWGHLIKGFYSRRSDVVPLMRKQGINDLQEVDEKICLDTHNVGFLAWYCAFMYLKARDIAIIGMDTCTIPEYQCITPGHVLYGRIFKEYYNEYFDDLCVCDPMWEMYRDDWIFYTNKYHKTVRTVNCTGAGSLFSENLKCLHLQEWMNESKLIIAQT